MKSLVLASTATSDGAATLAAAGARRPRRCNEVKAGKLAGPDDGCRFATDAEIDARDFGCKPGYLGPVGAGEPVPVIADRTVAAMSDFVCGANEDDYHFTGVNWGRDLPEPDVVADIRNVVAGDPSPDGKGALDDPARHRGRPRLPARHEVLPRR